MSYMLEKVEQFVHGSFQGGRIDVEHLARTVYWLKTLDPDAGESMMIAAYAHDIARAFDNEKVELWKNTELTDDAYLRQHQDASARIMSDFLHDQGYDKHKIEEVSNMIRHHEEGGTDRSDLIKDADSISYLEVGVSEHLNRFVRSIGKDKIRHKIEWMFNRITSEKAKEIARPLYEKAMRDLESI